MIKKYNITVNGNTYDVEVEEVGSEASTVSRPQATQNSPRPQAIPNQSQKPQAVPVAGGDNILSPMPGTINDVRVKAGDSIKKGQVLLILEAMKMENEIMANSDGTISAVNISKGSSVNVGDVLVTIK